VNEGYDYLIIRLAYRFDLYVIFLKGCADGFKGYEYGFKPYQHCVEKKLKWPLILRFQSKNGDILEIK